MCGLRTLPRRHALPRRHRHEPVRRAFPAAARALAAAQGGTFALARRDDVELHLSLGERHLGGGRGWAYLQVDDADALHREWHEAGIADMRAPTNAPYGMRDGSHVDPDGNLIMFGSRLP